MELIEHFLIYELNNYTKAYFNLMKSYFLLGIFAMERRKEEIDKQKGILNEISYRKTGACAIKYYYS